MIWTTLSELGPPLPEDDGPTVPLRSLYLGCSPILQSRRLALSGLFLLRPTAGRYRGLPNHRYSICGFVAQDDC